MKALVLSVTAGNGHNATAKAICAYLQSIGCEAEMLDTFSYVSPTLADAINEGYLFLSSRAKPVYKNAYRLAEKRKKSRSDLSMTRGSVSILAKMLLDYINEYDPDVIICTHIFAGIILDVLKEKGEVTSHCIAILTDFAFHPFWEEGLHLDYVVMPSELLTAQALKKGYREDQLLSFGIPIHPKFANAMSKAEARAKLGLDLEKRTVLLMSGSMGYGNIEKTVELLDRVPYDFQIITVCGNNASAKAKIDGMKTSKRILSLGFVDYVEQLMDASDCIITKPGGLTSSEAMAKQLPMIIVNPIPGQEDRNTEFFTNNGAAMSVTHTLPLDEVMYQLFSQPRRIDLMRESISLLAKPNSTRDICEFAKKLAMENTPEIIDAGDESK